MTKKHQDDPNAGSFFLDSPAGSTLIPKDSFDEASHTPIPEVHAQPELVRSEYDPNAREAARLRQNDAGGGFASALEGEFSAGATEAVVAEAADISKSRLDNVQSDSYGQTSWLLSPAQQMRGMSKLAKEEQKLKNRRGRAAAEEVIRLGLK